MDDKEFVSTNDLKNLEKYINGGDSDEDNIVE